MQCEALRSQMVEQIREAHCVARQQVSSMPQVLLPQHKLAMGTLQALLNLVCGSQQHIHIAQPLLNVAGRLMQAVQRIHVLLEPEFSCMSSVIFNSTKSSENTQAMPPMQLRFVDFDGIVLQVLAGNAPRSGLSSGGSSLRLAAHQ